MRKWAFVLPLSFCLLSSGTSYANSADNQSTIVIVNDHVMNFDVKPIIDQGMVFVPIRSIVDELGGKITFWKNNEISLSKGAITVTLSIGSTIVKKNQEHFSLKAAPKLIKGRTLVPLRFLSEALGASVNYESHRVSIRTTDDSEQSHAASGNSIGNLNNSGWYATDKEWIYFNNQRDNGKLYKEKIDGSYNQKVSDEKYVGYINIVNQKLYYGVSSLAVSGGKIFYTIDGRKLFVMDADGSNKKKLVDGSYIAWVDVKERSLFFNLNEQLYSMGTDGTSLTKISDHNARNINVQGDWLYYSNYSEYSKKLFRINLVDHTTQKLNDEKTFYLHIISNKIFFYNPDVSSVEEIIVE
ncbi:DUF5050 domain-containing protein [Paenibacillus sp. PL91]|uniref:DUF5050 domain-containing protein n=1 Tax=Paenibacillus sp. PL91 TaxID=2729538 RepID=UPI00145EBF62|nr:DUF5050 domain-containing protein [Paenibacillus sp. PL91]MBC9200899.1 DUF5050 domain-containing protein [Paenibacillus sp. PL91]